MKRLFLGGILLCISDVAVQLLHNPCTTVAQLLHDFGIIVVLEIERIKGLSKCLVLEI